MRRLEVTFVNYDGAMLQRSLVDFGETPEYTGKTPEKAATARYTYSFAGWMPKVVAATSDAIYTATYTNTLKKGSLTFDLGGGTIDGKTSLTIEADVGDVIAIPDAPVRDGYTFKYWKGSEYYPGDKYTVEGDHSFTAVWEQKSDGGGGNADTRGTSSNDSEKSSAAKTSDKLGGAISVLGAVAVFASCLAFFALYRRRQRASHRSK